MMSSKYQIALVIGILFILFYSLTWEELTIKIMSIVVLKRIYKLIKLFRDA